MEVVDDKGKSVINSHLAKLGKASVSEMTQEEFKIAIKTLNSTLQDIVDAELLQVPEKILPTFYSIRFIILLDDWTKP